jgi:hypothetical protein
VATAVATTLTTKTKFLWAGAKNLNYIRTVNCFRNSSHSRDMNWGSSGQEPGTLDHQH